MKYLFITILFVSSLCNEKLFPQFLSHLNASEDDALYTTYAAPLDRSSYLSDQGYHFRFYDGDHGIEMVSEQGPSLGIAFISGKHLYFKLDELYRKPIITVSYSDFLKYYYYPLQNLKVEVTFVVYNSQTAVTCYRITNSGSAPITVSLIPYLYYHTSDSIISLTHEDSSDAYSFLLTKTRDKWMCEHNIPLIENMRGYFCSNLRFDSTMVFGIEPEVTVTESDDLLSPLKHSIYILKKRSKGIKGIAGLRTINIQAGETTSFNVNICITDARLRKSDEIQKLVDLYHLDFESVQKSDENTYAQIPNLKITTKENEMLYWSSFSLLRQCMMPAEGECHYNYYVFSREPRWGWGYGGQVFHESLAMLAYAYMDPQGAMNSQKVFMERQYENGYINYRTGPYLNETIETSGRLTTSAPWFNYENLEIFRISRDKKFLEKAYESGKKFYKYFVANRDSNNNGLCEWGGHAELESVRDSRVAVWDKVGWPGNFEGPDLNSMLVMEAKSLAEMAKLLGKHRDAKFWMEDSEKRTDKINEKLWDKETKFYYNVNRINQSFTFHSRGDLKIKEIIGFLPLWAGVSNINQTRILVDKMKDTEEFWRPFGVPSLSAKSDYYCPIGYWNGPVWVQWNYLLFRGLLDHGFHNEAADLAEKVMGNMVYHLKKDHDFWELYSADDHQAGWNKTYIWAGIAARFLIDLNLMKSSESKGK